MPHALARPHASRHGIAAIALPHARRGRKHKQQQPAMTARAAKHTQATPLAAAPGWAGAPSVLRRHKPGHVGLRVWGFRVPKTQPHVHTHASVANRYPNISSLIHIHLCCILARMRWRIQTPPPRPRRRVSAGRRFTYGHVQFNKMPRSKVMGPAAANMHAVML